VGELGQLTGTGLGPSIHDGKLGDAAPAGTAPGNPPPPAINVLWYAERGQFQIFRMMDWYVDKAKSK